MMVSAPVNSIQGTRDMVIIVPVNRQHIGEREGAKTDIPNINIIPNDEIRKTLEIPKSETCAR